MSEPKMLVLDDPGWQEVVGEIKNLRNLVKAREEISTQISVMEADIIERLDGCAIEVDGIVWGAKADMARRFDDEGLAMLVAAWAYNNRQPDENGVLPDPAPTIARALLDVAKISYWRTTQLEKLGILTDEQMGDYRDYEFKRKRLVDINATRRSGAPPITKP